MPQCRLHHLSRVKVDRAGFPEKPLPQLPAQVWRAGEINWDR
jgi:hypothetical protein